MVGSPFFKHDGPKLSFIFVILSNSREDVLAAGVAECGARFCFESFYKFECMVESRGRSQGLKPWIAQEPDRTPEAFFYGAKEDLVGQVVLS
jgi:hypothetical protein